jgi:RNA polymerase sigma-70 factor (ECF subfamily)
MDHRDETADASTDPLDATGLYQRALNLLRTDFAESTWQAFLATAVDGRSAADVAEDLGMTVGAVYVAKSRVLARLREELAGLEE